MPLNPKSNAQTAMELSIKSLQGDVKTLASDVSSLKMDMKDVKRGLQYLLDRASSRTPKAQ